MLVVLFLLPLESFIHDCVLMMLGHLPIDSQVFTVVGVLASVDRIPRLLLVVISFLELSLLVSSSKCDLFKVDGVGVRAWSKRLAQVDLRDLVFLNFLGLFLLSFLLRLLLLLGLAWSSSLLWLIRLQIHVLGGLFVGRLSGEELRLVKHLLVVVMGLQTSGC